MTLYGWDASDFDWGRGPMDLAAARRDGISFFTHKATESTDTQHGHYGEAMNRAKAAGVPFLGAYHVVRTLDINAQVAYFLAYVNAQTPWWKTFGGWFFQADLEKWAYDAVSAPMGVAFAAEVERRTGRRCILYAPRWAYGNSLGGSAPLWASAYGSNPAGSYRNLYPGDGNATAWQAYSGRVPAILQYGSQATIGSQHGCDINAFRGSVADFAALIHGEAALGGGTPITGVEMLDPADPIVIKLLAQTATANSGLTVADQQGDHNAALNTLKLAGQLASMLTAVQGAEASQVAALNAIKATVAAPGQVDVQTLAAAISSNLDQHLIHDLIAALSAKLGA